jgi:hypothetical protein
MLEKQREIKGKGGEGARGLLGRHGRALAFGRRSGVARVGGRLGQAWSGRLDPFFSFLFSYFFHNFCILASNELKPISKFF